MAHVAWAPGFPQGVESPRVFGHLLSDPSVDAIYHQNPNGGRHLRVEEGELRGPPEGRPFPLELNQTFGFGLRYIKLATYMLVAMWPVYMVIAWSMLGCNFNAKTAHAAQYPSWMYLIPAPVIFCAVLAEWKALHYCMRPFKEQRHHAGMRSKLSILGCLPVGDTVYIIFRLAMTAVNVSSLFLFGFSAVQAVADRYCRGADLWSFAWVATFLQSFFSCFSIYFWTNIANLPNCYYVCAVLLFIGFPRALLHSIPTEDVNIDPRGEYVQFSNGRWGWGEIRAGTYYKALCRCWTGAVKRALECCCGGAYRMCRECGLCHCLGGVWSSTFFSDAGASLAIVVGFACLRDISETLHRCQLAGMLAPWRRNDPDNLSRMQRRMILVLEATLRQTLYHTFTKGALILNVQVTQFMLHRAVMLKTINSISLDKGSLVSILVTVGTTLMFDPIQLVLTLYKVFQVETALKQYAGPPLHQHHVEDKKTIRMLVVRIVFWALVGYGGLLYAVLKLHSTLFVCQGEGWNWKGCAKIPWHCMDTADDVGVKRCIIQG